MPRKTPLPETEKAICKRLSAIRRFHHLTQPELAEIVGTSEGLIANIEAERTPLRADTGMVICRKLKVNPGWLHDGSGTPKFPRNVLHSLLNKQPAKRLLFSVYFKTVLSLEFADLVNKGRESFANLAEILNKQARSLPDLPQTPENRRMIKREIRQLMELIESLKSARALENEVNELIESNDLTEAASEDKNAEVKLLLPNLLKRLNERTAEPGKKSELAEYLGAPLASVSRWLSGSREPGGEITLKMLHWVELQERK